MYIRYLEAVQVGTHDGILPSFVMLLLSTVGLSLLFDVLSTAGLSLLFDIE